MRELGGLFGWATVVTVIGANLSYVCKYLNLKFGKKIRENKGLAPLWNMGMKLFLKNHPIFGIATLIFLSAHFIIQFMGSRLPYTGFIAAGILLCQGVLGGLVYTKKVSRKSFVFTTHRIFGLLLTIAILGHLFL